MASRWQQHTNKQLPQNGHFPMSRTKDTMLCRGGTLIDGIICEVKQHTNYNIYGVHQNVGAQDFNRRKVRCHLLSTCEWAGQRTMDDGIDAGVRWTALRFRIVAKKPLQTTTYREEEFPEASRTKNKIVWQGWGFVKHFDYAEMSETSMKKEVFGSRFWNF